MPTPLCRRHRLVRLGVVLLAVTVIAACSKPEPPPPLLPSSIAGWVAPQPPQVFAGDQLYAHINGAADLYHEYGFLKVVVGDYLQEADRITVEVYTMTAAAGAFGIYSATRSQRGEAVALGNGGTLGDCVLSLWSGNDLVVLTATNLQHGQRQVAALGDALAARFPATGSPPPLLAELPEEHRLTGSELYLPGPIALRNHAPRVQPLLPSIGEAVAARYQAEGGPQALLLLFVRPDENEAALVLAAAAAAAAKQPAATLTRTADEQFQLAFAGGELLVVSRRGRLVQVVVANSNDDLSQLPACCAIAPAPS